MATVPPTAPPADDPARIRRQRRVVGGVLLTFGGLLFAVLLLPTAPGPLLAALPTAGISLLAVWIGGILLGSGRGGGRRGVRSDAK